MSQTQSSAQSLPRFASLYQQWREGHVSERQPFNTKLFKSWPTDGVVAKVFDQKLQRKLGAGFECPNWAIALKKMASPELIEQRQYAESSPRGTEYQALPRGRYRWVAAGAKKPDRCGAQALQTL